jgi:NADH-quinone oxidoreductase subunit E
LRGADEILDHICKVAHMRPGECSPNGKLTIEFAECLGACEMAPCMLTGEVLHKDLTKESAERFVKEVIGK